MFNKSENLTWDFDPEFDYIVDEKGSTFLALRKVKWGSSEEFKLDLRKYYNSAKGEVMGKGVGFLTPEGPHDLIDTMTRIGYGHTKDILEGIKDREDFRSSLNKVLGQDDKLYDTSIPKDTEIFYDPRSVLLDESQDDKEG